MPRVRLIHSDPAEARDHAARLREAGYVVNHRQLDASWQVPLRRNPPDAVVIDLSRVPSMGRDVGVALRSSEGTRGVPIVFVGGDSKKLPGIKKLLPDATYTTWGRIRSALKHAIARPLVVPITHDSALAGYSGTPLLKKLGIKRDAVVALLGAPEDFEKTLGSLPVGTKLRRDARGRLQPMDPGRLGSVGRLGGIAYTQTTDRFELIRPKVEPPPTNRGDAQ